MIRRISEKLANFLLSKNVIEKSEIDIYVYGYEVLISSLVDFLIIIAIGYIFNRIIAMLLFFIMFVSVRLYTGGYHAETFLKCKIVFVFICISIILLSKMDLPFITVILIMLLYNAASALITPVENINKPLNDNEKLKYRKISIILSIIWSAISIFTYFNSIDSCQIITLTAFFITLLMVIGKYRKGGNVNES